MIIDNASYMVIPHLTREIRVVKLAAEGSETKRDELTSNHCQSKLLKRVKIYTNDDVCIVQLISLCVQCIVP